MPGAMQNRNESSRTEPSTTQEPHLTSEENVAPSDAREPEPDHRRGPAKLNREQALAVMKAHLAAVKASREST